VFGMVCLIASLVVMPAGFLQMVYALEHGGYGTSSNTLALITLGVGGALLGIGMSLVIWELSIRHNIRH
jgi:hypothetical protein